MHFILILFAPVATDHRAQVITEGCRQVKAGVQDIGTLTMTKFDNTLLYRIYLIKLDIFIGFQNPDMGSRSDISNLR
jgi:hypothetical protein